MAGDFIVEFCLPSGVRERAHRFLAEMPRDILQSIHQRSDLSDVYYAPHAMFGKLNTNWPSTLERLIPLKEIPADSVVLLHCSTYTKRYDYLSQEVNLKAIVLSKGYDIGICTGRTFTRHYCSDLMYVDRFFSYRFGDRKYWFICYSSSLDDEQLINDKLEELFGAERGPTIYLELKQIINRTKE